MPPPHALVQRQRTTIAKALANIQTSFSHNGMGFSTISGLHPEQVIVFVMYYIQMLPTVQVCLYHFPLFLGRNQAKSATVSRPAA